MQEIKLCHICNSNDFTSLHKENDYQIYECNKCGVLFTNSIEGIEDEITEDYWSDIEEDSTKNFAKYEQNHKYYVKCVLKIFQTSKKIKLLDIGCGFGFFIHHAKSKGIDVSGIDLSKLSTDYASKIMGLKNIFNHNITSHLQTKRHYDVITAFNVFEHVHRPKIMAERMYKIVKNNGYILIRVPNATFHKIISKIMNNILLRKNNKYSILATHPPSHLFGYSRYNLKILLESVGFKNIRAFPSPLSVRTDGINYHHLVSIASNFLYYASFKMLLIAPTIYVIAKKQDTRLN